MSIELFDTLRAAKVPLETVEPGKVRMYVCGLTVYDFAHIGHARAFIAFDVIRRYLVHRGYDVTFVQNHTDVDDKIIARANETGQDPLALSARFIEELEADMDGLNLMEPDVAPRVSQEIPEIISMIERLIERGHAYTVGTNVYFEVSTFSGYGKLSKKVLEDLRAGERVDVDESKRSPADFALWKATKPGEPSWPSPWGQGRPGWHIECSAMSTRYLGPTFDIHGGGVDLVFPHHENEIAQSEGATGEPFVKYWLHAGHLTLEGEKMSKSLGNVWLIRDILAIHHPDVVRYFMVTGHYRRPVNYTEDSLEEARSRVVYYYKTIGRIEQLVAMSPPVDSKAKLAKEAAVAGYWDAVHADMDDDFNTCRFLAHMSELARLANELMPKKNKPIADPSPLRTLDTIRAHLLQSGKILGIFGDSPQKALKKIRMLRARQLGLDETAIEALIAERANARADKNWQRADEIRDQLDEMRVVCMDSQLGTDWELK